jgi:hypothetical protein
MRSNEVSIIAASCRAVARTLVFSWVALLSMAGGPGIEEKGSGLASPVIAGEVRYHFRERLEGIKPGGKKFSAPAEERETLPPSRLLRSNAGEIRVVEGGVAHLPYRFTIKLTRSQDTGAETLEVTILDSTGKLLSGYPQTMENPFAKAARPSNKQFKIPVSEALAKTLEKTLLAKNQFLTHVDLSIDYSP